MEFVRLAEQSVLLKNYVKRSRNRTVLFCLLINKKLLKCIALDFVNKQSLKNPFGNCNFAKLSEIP